MSRLRYGRSGSAVWISHLDMMRLFQRAFARAGIRIRHSAGFNPHALISIALPMSVGTASVCELLDFSVESGCDDLGSLPARLNACLPGGVRVFEAYESERVTTAYTPESDILAVIISFSVLTVLLSSARLYI